MANVKFEFNGKLSDGRFFDEDSKKKVLVELEDSDLTVGEMLEEFMNFMQAIGYKFELGDRFDVVNDFKTEVKKEKQEELKIDFSKYDFKSESGYGAVPPQAIVDEGGTVIGMATGSPKKQVDPYLLGSEIDRLRDIMVGVSEEALEMAAYNNLVAKGLV